jgi:hypothetical protein
VQLISPMLESSSESHIENEGESLASLREEAITEPVINASAKDFEGKHDDLNENQTENHSSKEENYLKNESNQVVKDHIEKDQSDKGDISQDPALPMVNEVTNSEDTLGESDKMDKNEVADKELHKNNQTMVLSELEGETDKITDIVHTNDP